jgi:hypothetical protein
VLVGREAECARLRSLVDATREGRSGVVVLRGEGGAGKTALIEEAVTTAAGLLVLRAHGVESESELPYAGLHQLLRPVAAELGRLADPQADALRAAFGLREGRGDERFLVSLAVLSLLGELAERRPVLCVVDDAHWLDQGSIDALAFVARRLEAEPVAMIFVVREPVGPAFPATDLPALPVGPLDPDAAGPLLERYGGVPAHPGVRARLLAATGGNALALAELAEALDPDQLSGARPLPEPLPLTSGIEQAFLDRVRRLPPSTRTALLVAAADDTTKLATVVAAAARLGVPAEAFAPAEQAGVVAVEGGAIRFRHPLVRSAVHEGATSTDRRAAHAALAAVLAEQGEDDLCAWHRAAAALGSDAEVAVALAAAAGRARARGAFTAAAAALARAAELAPDAQQRGRLLTEAGYHAWRGGQTHTARRLLDQARPLAADPFLQADVDRMRGTAELGSGDAAAAYRILTDAAVRIGPLDPLRALHMLAVACEAASMALSREGAAHVGRLATELPTTDAPEAAFLIDLLVGFGHLFAADRPDGVERLDSAVARTGPLDDPDLLLLGWRAALYLGDDAAAHRLATTAAARARGAGNAGLVPIAGMRIALTEVLAGRWDASIASGTEALHHHERAGRPFERARTELAFGVALRRAPPPRRGPAAPARRVRHLRAARRRAVGRAGAVGISSRTELVRYVVESAAAAG